MLILILVLTLVEIAANGFVLYTWLWPSPPPEVHQAIRDALRECGLNSAYADPKSDLLKTGKLDDVLYHASALLGRPIRTTKDVETLLTRRFR